MSRRIASCHTYQLQKTIVGTIKANYNSYENNGLIERLCQFAVQSDIQDSGRILRTTDILFVECPETSVIFGPIISIQNSVSHRNERIQITSKYWIVLKPNYVAKSKRRPQQKASKFELHLQFMGLRTRLNISRLAECVPSNRFTESVDFTTACRQGSHWSLIYAGYREAVPNCNTLLTRDLTRVS